MPIEQNGAWFELTGSLQYTNLIGIYKVQVRVLHPIKKPRSY